MTPEQIALVRQTLDDCAGSMDALVATFYDHLFTAVPETRALFPDDLTTLRAKFAEELAAIVTSISDLDHFVDRARDLGERHAGYGVRHGHYRAVRDALLAALRDGLGPRFTPAHEEAWRRAFNLVAEVMQQGATPEPARPTLRGR